MRWIASFLSVSLLFVCSVLQPVGLEWILAGTWAESGRDQSDKVTASTDVVEVSLPGLPEGAYPMRLVRIPAGSFQMGSPDTERSRYANEGPVHLVTIGYDFYLGITEVTQAQWQALMGSIPSSGSGVGNDYPVYDVSWNAITQANGFLARLNALGQGIFRLPTESEWEYACRAGTATRFYFGDSLGCDDDNQDCAAGTLPGNRSDYMWYRYNYLTPSYGTKPAGGKWPNAFGLYGMHGNVFEWCQDDWHDSYNGAPTDGSAWTQEDSSYRVIRGGDWYNYAKLARSAFRTKNNPATSMYDMGFRVALDVKASSIRHWELFE